jgi:hypothetical protein
MQERLRKGFFCNCEGIGDAGPASAGFVPILGKSMLDFLWLSV